MPKDSTKAEVKPCQNMAELTKTAKAILAEVKGGVSTSNFNSVYLRFKRVAVTQKNAPLHKAIKASSYKGYRHFFSEIAKAEKPFEAYKKARLARVKANKAKLAKNAGEKAEAKVPQVKLATA